jgi:RNA polymerase sigma-70 factor (ECF subfamily)
MLPTEWASCGPAPPVPLEAELEREFEERLRESGTLAFRVAYGVLRHRQDAEDVAQDALVKAYRCFRQLRDPERFQTWLVRLTWRLAIDRARGDRRRTQRELAATLPDPAAGADEIAAAEERSALLWRAIDALSEKLRIVIVLAAIQGHDVRKVAKLLGLPEGTIKSRLFQARKELAERLQCLMSDSR